MRVHIRKDRLGQPAPLRQVAEVEDGGLIRDPVVAQLDPGEPAHRLAVIQRLLGHRIAQRIPVLQEMHPQHRLQRHRGPPALRPQLRIIRRDQRQQTTPGHHRVRRCARTSGACASLSAKNSSRRVRFFFIASRSPGKAGCFGIGRTPCKHAQHYQIRQTAGGYSDVP